jgi:hypothetical protein
MILRPFDGCADCNHQLSDLIAVAEPDGTNGVEQIGVKKVLTLRVED